MSSKSACRETLSTSAIGPILCYVLLQPDESHAHPARVSHGGRHENERTLWLEASHEIFRDRCVQQTDRFTRRVKCGPATATLISVSFVIGQVRDHRYGLVHLYRWTSQRLLTGTASGQADLTSVAGLPDCRRLPIPVLTEPDVQQLYVDQNSKPTRYHCAETASVRA